MKIAVSADGKDLSARIDPRFGRCAYFILVETEDLNFEVFDNENMALGGGAGIQAAQFVASKGAKAVITGNCGPNAVRTLNAAGVEMILGQSGSVGDAIESFKRGKLVSATEPNVGDHNGMRHPPAATSNPPRFGRGMGMGRKMGCGGGMGRGMGLGRGMDLSAGSAPTRSAPGAVSRDQELKALKDQADEMRRQIEAMGARLRNLERE